MLSVASASRMALLRTAKGVVRVNARALSSVHVALLPDRVDLPMPALSPTMTEGSISSWSVAVGDKVGPGDVLGMVETDKTQVDFTTEEEGYIAGLYAEEGESGIPIGKLVAIMVEDEEDVAAFADWVPTASDDASEEVETVAAAPADTPSSTPAVVAAAAPAPVAAAPVVPTGTRVAISPFARKLAADAGVPVEALATFGTGYEGRVKARDVEKYLANPPIAAAPAAAAAADTRSFETGVGLGSDAAASVVSKAEVPHFYLTQDVSVAKILKTKELLDSALDETSAKLSLQHFMVRAAGLACGDVPEANSSWRGDSIRQYHDVNVRLTIPTIDGTVSPVIKAVNAKGVSAIAQQTADFVEAAQTDEISSADLLGATFTVVEASDVVQVTPIVPGGNGVALGVGGVRDVVVPTAEGVEVDQQVTVTLSCDHRVVDGAVGAVWLQKFKAYLEDPLKMLL